MAMQRQQQLAGNAGRCSDGSVETTAWLNGSESLFKPQRQEEAPPTTAAVKTKCIKGEETEEEKN